MRSVLTYDRIYLEIKWYLCCALLALLIFLTYTCVIFGKPMTLWWYILLIVLYACVIACVYHFDVEFKKRFRISKSSNFFFNEEQIYWRSSRFYVFVALLPNSFFSGDYKKEIDRIIESAQYRQKYRQINILNNTLVRAIMSIVAVVLSVYLSHKSLSSLSLLLFVSLFSLTTIIMYLGIFRTQNDKLNDFILCLYWCKEYGEDVKKSLKSISNHNEAKIKAQP